MIVQSCKHGFVLLTTMFLLGILSLIVLRFSATLSLDFRILDGLNNNYTSLQDLESVADNIMHAVTNKMADFCITDKEKMFTYEFLMANGCQFGDKPYIYMLTDLGEFACLFVNFNGELYSSHHYLLQLLSINAPNRLLRVRFAILGGKIKCMHEINRNIQLGVQSWSHL